MPSRPRINLAGYPQYVVQRRHNQEVCFFAEGDYLFYLHWLRERKPNGLFRLTPRLFLWCVGSIFS